MVSLFVFFIVLAGPLVAETGDVGRINPIAVETVGVRFIERVGEYVGRGDSAVIQWVKECSPPRVFRVVKASKVRNGDELRIAQIASDLGVAPVYHGAYLLKQSSDDYLFMEFDYASKTLGKWMEYYAEELEAEKSCIEADDGVTDLKLDDPFYTVEVIKDKPRVDREEAFRRLFGSEQQFYFELFSVLKRLAENNIAYGDTHVGNIIPRSESSNQLQLIDFDDAELLGSPDEAARKTMQSLYNTLHFLEFLKCPNLTKESEELILWLMKD